MIIINDNRLPFKGFRNLLYDATKELNREASENEDYYLTRNGTKLEEDVTRILKRCALGTSFENTIERVSGKYFPDIVVGKYYGVEVKSTDKNHWKTIGNSILESTRINDVERIFITFGKLSPPVQFITRPYEEVISGISVTHYPRYQIDMRLGENETIFNKIGLSYDHIRNLKNPIEPVSVYYKSKLKEGEELWWAAGSSESAPPILRIWSTLSQEEKRRFTIQGYSLFPEILSDSLNKYHGFALWLVKKHSVINTNIRDQFSSGGKRNIGPFKGLPASLGRIYDNKDMIRNYILETSNEELKECWKTSSVRKNRIQQWIELAASYSTFPDSLSFFQYIFRYLN